MAAAKDGGSGGGRVAAAESVAVSRTNDDNSS